MDTVEIQVKGYKIYCESDTHELYDIFIPNKDYRMSSSDASGYIPTSHKVIAVKRDTRTFNVKYEDLKEINQNN